MGFKDYSGSEQFRPLSAFAYFGYGILFAIPIIGWLFLLIFTFSTKNYNRRSFARSYWCSLIVVVIVIAIFMATGVGFGWLYEKVPTLRQYLPKISTTFVQTTASPTAGEAASAVNVTVTPSTEPAKQVEQSNSGVTTEFKAMMDEYEAFFDSYIEFMESFDSTNSTLTQMTKYAEMITQYSETMETLDGIDESTLSEADEHYQIQVMLRINQKLAAFAEKQ